MLTPHYAFVIIVNTIVEYKRRRAVQLYLSRHSANVRYGFIEHYIHAN